MINSVSVGVASRSQLPSQTRLILLALLLIAVIIRVLTVEIILVSSANLDISVPSY